MINKNEIEEALSFYQIDNKDYIYSCYKCIDIINKNKGIRIKCDFIIKNIVDDYKYLDSIKHLNIKSLFGEDYPQYITNILLLSFYKIDNNNIFKCDEDRIIHHNMVKKALLNDIYDRKLSSIRVSQMVWGIKYALMHIIDVGRLTYELSLINPLNQKNEKCIKIHISNQNKLDYNDVVKSLSDSNKKIKYYFNKLNYQLYCESWLLSKELLNLLDNNSNIKKFSYLFEIKNGNKCDDEILNFVFKKDIDYNYKLLDENTSLQKNIKKYLLNSNHFSMGIGTLKNNYISSTNE